MFSLFCNVSHDCFFIDLFRHLAVRYTFYSSSIQSLSFFFFLTAVFLICMSSFCLGLYHCCFLFLSLSMFVTQPLGLCVTVFRFLFTLSVFLSLAVSLVLSFLQCVEFLLWGRQSGWPDWTAARRHSTLWSQRVCSKFFLGILKARIYAYNQTDMILLYVCIPSYVECYCRHRSPRACLFAFAILAFPFVSTLC